MRRRWQPSEDALLRQYFEVESYAKMASRLGRHRATVRRRLRGLGLRRDGATLRRFQRDASREHAVQYSFVPHGLAPDAEPLSCDDQERWWKKHRAADEAFLALLRKFS